MIFITGCNGLAGSFLARELVSKGETIRALKRPDSDMSLLGTCAQKIEWVEGDICDVTILDEALKGVNQVIHTAAIVSYLPQDREKMYKVNVEGTANVVNAAIRNSVQKFCQLSSVSAFGKNAKENIVSETVKLTNAEFSSFYGYTKFLAELEIFRGIEEGLDAFMVNPSVIIGPGDWNKSSTKLFRYVREEKPFYTKGKMNYIDVRDVTSIIIQLMTQTNITGEKFILNAGSISYKDFFELIAKSLNKRPPRYQANAFLSEIAWRFSAIKSTITGKPPLISKETARLSGNSHLYDNAKIKNRLNYSFRDIKDSINWTCHQLLEKKEK
ncbi:NAD-dependent epimerase/dehydratase family protein [Cytophagaceae bacterium ABcell3]|nr:NAD-dependent epimerase/dehydratase family protein [Cytophagaceae bacterium ABcell3]